MEETSENEATNKVSEKLDMEENHSPGFHDFLEDDFLESLAVVDSWKAEDEEIEHQESKEKIGSHNNRRPTRDRGDRKDRRSSERNRTDQRRSRERIRDRGMNYRYDRYSHNRYTPRHNDRIPKDINNLGSNRTRNEIEKYQRNSLDDVKSKRDKIDEHKPGAEMEEQKSRASSPHKTLAEIEEKNKLTQEDGTASTLVSPPKLSSEQPIAIDTCIKDITDVVPPGTEEEFVNLAKNVGGKPQGFSEPEWSKRDLPAEEHKQIEKDGRNRSPIEYSRRPPEREYKHGDYMKQYERSRSREREPFYKNRPRSNEMHFPSTTRRSRSRERQTPTTKRRSRSRERQMPTVKARSRSRERQPLTIKRRSRSRERQMPTIKRSRSRERRTPTIKRRSQSREKLLDTMKKKLRRKKEKHSPTTKRTRSSWSPDKRTKGTSGRQSPNRRPYSSKTRDNYKVVDPELSPVSGTSLSSPSLSLSPVSSEGERWRRRNFDRRSPFSLSPARSYISLSSEHSDRSPKRKRSPFWREIQRTFAAQDMAKSHYSKIPPPTQQSYYQSKPLPAQPVSYPAELYPNSAPNYPPPTVNYYQPPTIQPPPPGEFMVSQPIASSTTAPTMVPPVPAPMMVPPVSAPMMVPPVSTPTMVPPVTQMAPITYPNLPCPVPPPVQPVIQLQVNPPNNAAWPQQINETGRPPKWEPEHVGGTPNWEPERHISTSNWEPKKSDSTLKWERENDGAKKWEPEKHSAAPKWESEKHDAPKWEPQKRGNAPKWEPPKHGGTSRQESIRNNEDEELIPPPPPTISQPEKSLSSLLEDSAKAGVTEKKQSSVEHNVVNRCEEALRTLSADRGLVLSSSGSFVFHRDEQPQNPLLQESTSRFQSPLLRNPTPVLNFTEPPTLKSSLDTEKSKVEEGEGKKPSLLVNAAAKLASKEMTAYPTALHNKVPPCLKCAEREKKKFVECSSQTSVVSRTVALQCDNIRGEIKAFFEPEFGDNAPSVYRRYQPLPQPPKGILKSSRY